MIAMARRRNREHVQAGRATFEAVALEEVDLGKRRFDTVFAFNVAPFWLKPEMAFGMVRDHFAKRGRFYLFWDARHTGGRTRELVEELSARVHSNGFAIDRVVTRKLRPVSAVCVISRPT